MAPRGKPSVATTTWYLVPSLLRSVGLGPVSAPPRLALTEQLSTTTSHAATSGPERTIQTRATWTRRSTAVALQSSRRRRKVEPEARPAVARSSRHCTPSRTKKRSASTTSMVGRGGRPVPYRRSSIRSMIPATNAAALDAMLASRCRRHGKRAPGAPDAERLTSYGVLETAPKPKARFSEPGDAVCDDEDAGGGQEGQDHAAQPVVTPIQPLVGQQPRAIVLDHAADRAEPGAVRLAHLPDEGPDALARAEPAVAGAVVARVGVQPADRGADGQGQAQQVREEPRVVDVGGRGHGGQREAVGRGHHVVLGPGLAAVGGVGAGQLAAALGPDRTTVDHDVPRGGLGSRAHHPDQGDMGLVQQGRGAPAVQAVAQGGAAGAPGRGPQLPPLHALTDEEAQRLDDLDGRQGWPPGPVPPVLDPVDDPRHQRRCPRRHARLPMPKARETSARGAGCREADELRGSGNRPLYRSAECPTFRRLPALAGP